MNDDDDWMEGFRWMSFHDKGILGFLINIAPLRMHASPTDGPERNEFIVGFGMATYGRGEEWMNDSYRERDIYEKWNKHIMMRILLINLFDRQSQEK